MAPIRRARIDGGKLEGVAAAAVERELVPSEKEASGEEEDADGVQGEDVEEKEQEAGLGGLLHVREHLNASPSPSPSSSAAAAECAYCSDLGEGFRVRV
jgi:hypothetical protein